MLNKAINSFLAVFGLKMSRLRHDDAHRIVRGLKDNRINVVFDVGANTGQFASVIRRAGYRGTIICFEPLPEAHEALERRVKTDGNTVVHPRAALGDTQGLVEINVSRNSVSSSILQLLPSHSTAAPDSIYVDAVETPVDRLDNVFDEYVSQGDRVFLKIDTQGYEWHVLDGAAQSLQRIDGLLLEMSLIPLYDGQRLWKELLDRLQGEGFVLWQVLPGLADPQSGRTLQFDGVFYRTEMASGS